MQYTPIRLLILLITSLLIISCASNNGTEVHIDMQTAKYLNPDLTGKPSPIVLNFYELKTPFSFKQASYNSLTNNPGSVLGSNLIDKQSIELRPGSKHKMTQWVSLNSHYMGITAAYRNIDKAIWRKVIKIPRKTKKIKLLINLESQGLIVTLDH